MGIALRGRKPGMAQNLLDRPQISAFLQHVGSKGVAQRVRMHVGGKAMGERKLLHDAADAARRQAAICRATEHSAAALRPQIQIRERPASHPASFCARRANRRGSPTPPHRPAEHIAPCAPCRAPAGIHCPIEYLPGSTPPIPHCECRSHTAAPESRDPAPAMPFPRPDH